jgi:hypothetical protein
MCILEKMLLERDGIPVKNIQELCDYLIFEKYYYKKLERMAPVFGLKI